MSPMQSDQKARFMPPTGAVTPDLYARVNPYEVQAEVGGSVSNICGAWNEGVIQHCVDL